MKVDHRLNSQNIFGPKTERKKNENTGRRTNEKNSWRKSRNRTEKRKGKKLLASYKFLLFLLFFFFFFFNFYKCACGFPVFINEYIIFTALAETIENVCASYPFTRSFFFAFFSSSQNREKEKKIEKKRFPFPFSLLLQFHFHATKGKKSK